MLRALINPKFLFGAGSMVLFGAGIYGYSEHFSQETGFHVRDPDKSLRMVEKDVLIPKIMRDLSRTQDCAAEVEIFTKCWKQFKPGSLKSYLTFKYCKNENDAMMKCMNDKFVDMDFYYKCKDIYLQEQKLFKITDIEKNYRAHVKDIILNGKSPGPMGEAMQKYFNGVKTEYQLSNDINRYDDNLLKLSVK